jgi:hypothetical protein
MHATENELIYEAVVAFVVAGLIDLAYSAGGFLGVGVLGLLIAVIAFQADNNKTAPSHIVMTGPAPERADHRAKRFEAGLLATPILVGKLLGIVLVVVGFGVSFFF